MFFAHAKHIHLPSHSPLFVTEQAAEVARLRHLCDRAYQVAENIDGELEDATGALEASLEAIDEADNLGDRELELDRLDGGELDRIDHWTDNPADIDSTCVTDEAIAGEVAL